MEDEGNWFQLQLATTCIVQNQVALEIRWLEGILPGLLRYEDWLLAIKMKARINHYLNLILQFQ